MELKTSTAEPTKVRFVSNPNQCVVYKNNTELKAIGRDVQDVMLS